MLSRPVLTLQAQLELLGEGTQLAAYLPSRFCKDRAGNCPHESCLKFDSTFT